MKSGENILVKVIQLGTSEVKYKRKIIKILLFLLMLLVSFISNSQEQKYKLKKIKTISYVREYIDDTPKYEHWNSISIGVSLYGNAYYERRREPKEDGFGLDIYRDKVIYPDNFWNENYSETDKFILSSNKRFGMGIYYITPLKYGFDFFAGVGILRYYLPSSLLALPHNLIIKPSAYWYFIFGFTKEVRIAERFHLEMKGIFRNVVKYTIVQLNSHVTNFEPSLGLRYDITLKNKQFMVDQ